MKKTYEQPIINLVEVKIEKGFATSNASDSFGIENFSEAVPDDANSAW